MRRWESWEVNVNAVCNAVCRDCNRAIGMAKFRNLDMTAEQMRKAVDRMLEQGVRVKRIGMLGGEPILNKELQGIIDEADRLNPKIGHVLTNDMPRTKHLRDRIRLPKGWKWRKAPLDDPHDPQSGKSHHDAFFVSPKDLGIEATYEECRVKYSCGRGLDSCGWSMCGVAATLGRLLRVNPYETDGIVTHETPGICEHCVYGLPKKTQRWIYRMAREGKIPNVSETYKRAFQQYAEDPIQFPRAFEESEVRA